MILKNLTRRKGRTLLTILAISIGVAAIIGLGALADGLEAGYDSMLNGSQADLVISQPDSYDISFSAVDEEIVAEVKGMPEVRDASGMVQGFTQVETIPFFFVFGYPEDSFIFERFQIVEGVDLKDRTVARSSGKPIMIGSSAAESLNKEIDDTIRINESSFRIVGIYETGDALEDSGATLPLEDAQELLDKPRQVSVIYLQLEDPSLSDQLGTRVNRIWPDLSIGSTEDFADKQMMGDIIRGFVWAIAGLAIVIGGVGMMNAQLMSIFERTREIGVLRAVGWSRWRVMSMILAESILVSLIGGVLGLIIGWSLLTIFSDVVRMFGSSAANINPELILQALVVVLLLGLVGGLYPAWRASKLEPSEAIRYEGGTGSDAVRRLPVGGMPAQGLWQRSTRTLLTLLTIGLTVGAILALEGILQGFTKQMTQLAVGSDSQIVIREADIADTSLSAIDDREAKMIAALPEIDHVSRMVFTGIAMPEAGGFFIIQGYNPSEFAIQRLNITEGATLRTNRQVLLGKMMADALEKNVGDTIDLAGYRFKVTGIYESGTPWEEMGGVITARDAQSMLGKPRKSTMLFVKLQDPEEAENVLKKLDSTFPTLHASLSGDFVEQMPDMENSDQMVNGISFLAIIVGGIGVLNTMLMSVLERTREIGVLRAVGWPRRYVLNLILREAFLIGSLGAVAGILVAFLLTWLFGLVPIYGGVISPVWTFTLFSRAIIIALILGLLGGLFPAYRATKLEPVEALRYE
jgi:ABC-type antimicrobial peptide transport system permease subunit